MIVLVNRDTCKYANVPEEFICDMEELSQEIDGRAYPYTRLHIVDGKQKHDYYLDVVESKKQIEYLTEEAKKNGRTKKPENT